MPKGSPKPQTIANAKYQKKVGIIAKSYKLKAELAEDFAKACEKAGVSQAAQLTKMMEKFIKEVEEKGTGR